MAAERRRSARRDRADHAPLDPPHMTGVTAKIGLAMATQHIRDLDCWSDRSRLRVDHRRRGALVYPGGTTSNDNRSNGLCVARIVWVATCV